MYITTHSIHTCSYALLVCHIILSVHKQLGTIYQVYNGKLNSCSICFFCSASQAENSSIILVNIIESHDVLGFGGCVECGIHTHESMRDVARPIAINKCTHFWITWATHICWTCRQRKRERGGAENGNFIDWFDSGIDFLLLREGMNGVFVRVFIALAA